MEGGVNMKYIVTELSEMKTDIFECSFGELCELLTSLTPRKRVYGVTGESGECYKITVSCSSILIEEVA